MGMGERAKRRNVVIAVVLVVLIVLLALLLVRCKPAVVPSQPGTVSGGDGRAIDAGDAAPVQAGGEQAAEVLGEATVMGPAVVGAGARFGVTWTGPGNGGDFVVMVAHGAADDARGAYGVVGEGDVVEITAPMDAGAYELRYVTGRSKTVLGRAPIEVVEALATLDAADEVVAGAQVEVRWTGPDNSGDYITIVEKGAEDGRFANYANTSGGTPLRVLAPIVDGEAELRYMTGQGHRVLARRGIRVVAAEVTIEALAEVVAGAQVEVRWTGPNNSGDYITIVEKGTADGRFANFANTSGGVPLRVLAPIMDGEAELRYMTGQGHKVLGRRAIRVVAAEVTLRAPEEVKAGAMVSVEWTGPNNGGDYITVVMKGTEDGRFGAYAQTQSGTPVSVRAPAEAGEAEVRYMSGQGHRVLARMGIRIVP